MPNEPENLGLRQLRLMDGKLDRLLDDVHGLKVRVTAVEEGLSGVHRRLDRIEQRVDRIERRPDLVNV